MVGRLAFAVLLVAGLGACQRGGPLRQIVQGEELAFYNFTAPGSFEEGAYGAATLRAICAGDYLAFYANGQFLADAIDTTYARGQVGLAAGAANRLGVRIEFDNLTVYTAQSG